jgi:hypothetical protein
VSSLPGRRVSAQASFRDRGNCKVGALNAVRRQVRHLESIWYSQATRVTDDQRHGPGSCHPPTVNLLFHSVHAL